MKTIKDMNYRIIEDLQMYFAVENLCIEEVAADFNVSKNTVREMLYKGTIKNDTCEKFYSNIYELGYRLNSEKSKYFKNLYNRVLFHGSKSGLNEVTFNGSRKLCDFGQGFYLGDSYENALNFVCEQPNSNIYCFTLIDNNLKILELDVEFDWMLAICYYRGKLEKYRESKILRKIISRIEESDIVIAPIADNKMFYIMALFANGDINIDVAMHCLSEANLGKQYVIKSQKALDCLMPIEKLYLSAPEKNDCLNNLERRGMEIEDLLKRYKREYRSGLFIDEVFL